MPKVYNIKVKKMDANGVYVGRPSKWGNPFVIGRDGTRQQVIQKYEEWIQLQNFDFSELTGRDLYCNCSPLGCHADVLLKLANTVPGPEGYHMGWEEVRARVVNKMRECLGDRYGKELVNVYGVPRGGCIFVLLFGRPVDDPSDAEFIIDDIIDTGRTRDKFRMAFPDKPFVAIVDKTTYPDSELPWVVFPWERPYKFRFN